VPGIRNATIEPFLDLSVKGRCVISNERPISYNTVPEIFLYTWNISTKLNAI
jgi:hypothetical protein